MNTLLKVEKLAVGYSASPVVSDIEGQIPEGSLTALIGTNGAGKSTLLRTLMGLQPPLSGKIWLRQQDLTRMEAQTLSTQVASVFSRERGGHGLEVHQVVALGRTPYLAWHGRPGKQDKQVVEEVLQLTGLGDFASRKASSLSDGEWQRVMVARALAQQTPLILLDEPTSHLDLAAKVQLSLLLRDITRQAGRAVLFSTHDLDLAMQVADYLWVVHQGKAVWGTVEYLADSGVLDALFPKDLVVFDALTRRFLI